MARVFWCCLVLTAIPTINLERTRACATAGRKGVDVGIADESAIIIWDSASRVQHFIRHATFHADTPDFGFVVPTPSQPALAESRNDAFSFLEKLTAPEEVKVNEYLIIPNIGCKKKAGEGSVRVLEQQRVAGYDASVLESDNAQALNDWLVKHEYVTRPDLAAWLEPYVKNRWKITAFKIARDATPEEIASSAVYMSFATDRPFFPYSEPADQRGEKQTGRGRLLRVFFLADRRFAGELGAAKQEWPGRAVWAGVLADQSVRELTAQLKLDLSFQPVWLTVFDDSSSPRPGTADVFFVPASSQTEIRRPPLTTREQYFIGGWICLGVVVVLIALPVLRILGRRRGIPG
jgi:hypothetical protein